MTDIIELNKFKHERTEFVGEIDPILALEELIEEDDISNMVVCYVDKLGGIRYYAAGSEVGECWKALGLLERVKMAIRESAYDQ